MLRNIQQLPPHQRQFVFFTIFGGILLALIGLTALLASSALNPGERVSGIALVEGVTVREFAVLPDDDAYPASVAVLPDGGVITGSYATGVLWRIDAEGNAAEIFDTRDVIGAVIGLAVGADGTIYVVDQRDTDVRTGGGDVKRLAPRGVVTLFADVAASRGFLAPHDVTLDADGRVYVTDRGTNAVWRFEADGSGETVWWQPPADAEGVPRGAVTGLAYDATRNAIIVTDPEINVIYRVAVEDAAHEIVYEHPADSTTPPGFDGATVTPDGTLYVAALGQNGVVRVDEGAIEYIAGRFRGVSDVAYHEGRLYVANWDQASIGLALVRPRLPFAIDVIEIADSD